MHEFSLAQGLVSQLLALADQHNALKICTVRVAIGSQAGIVADSFAFGFDVLSRENGLLKDAVLEIIETHPQHRCLDCGGIMPFTLTKPSCSQCGSQRLASVGGDDLILSQIEME
ncbi:MAG TPA: hydrogenase accessory protein HypA [Desulfobulbaceae bacterium]|jgi:hydrogenase nickel incorporation protein HypA/HybF|nr:hydrogenase accessory protein HypA [Desulfobulbaceae bacterium]